MGNCCCLVGGKKNHPNATAHTTTASPINSHVKSPQVQQLKRVKQQQLQQQQHHHQSFNKNKKKGGSNKYDKKRKNSNTSDFNNIYYDDNVEIEYDDNNYTNHTKAKKYISNDLTNNIILNNQHQLQSNQAESDVNSSLLSYKKSPFITPCARRGSDNSQVINNINNDKIKKGQQYPGGLIKYQHEAVGSFGTPTTSSVFSSSSAVPLISKTNQHQTPRFSTNDANKTGRDLSDTEDAKLLNQTNVSQAPNGTVVTNQPSSFKNILLRKRSDYLNHSLNETDRNIYKNNSKDKQHLQKRKINLENEYEDDDDYDDDGDHETDDFYNDKYMTQTANTGIGGINSERAGSFNVKNNYRSLQKSKRSIKTIEETMKNSRSIEQWLNDFTKLKANDLNNTKRKPSVNQLDLINDKSSMSMHAGSINNLNTSDFTDENSETGSDNKKFKINHHHTEIKTVTEEDFNRNESSICDEDDDSMSSSNSEALLKTIEKSPLYKLVKEIINETTKDEDELNYLLKSTSSQNQNLVFRLFETINNLIRLNTVENVCKLEEQTSRILNKFLVPRSLANIEDIHFLKWLLNDSNFTLNLQQPLFNQQIIYTYDHLTQCNETSQSYLFNISNLNVDIVESDEQDELEDNDDLDEEFYFNEFNAAETDDKCYLKFKLFINDDTDVHSEQNCIGNLNILNKKIDKVLKMEKKLIDDCSKFDKLATPCSARNEDVLKVLEKFRNLYINTANFKGTQCLLNMKKKQILNRKSMTSTAKLLQHQQQSSSNFHQQRHMLNGNNKSSNKNRLSSEGLSPSISSNINTSSSSSASSTSSSILIKNQQNDNKLLSVPGVVSSVSSVSSSISPSLSSSSSNSSTNLLLINSNTKTVLTSPLLPSNLNQDYCITYSDLNEKVFSCLLSNYSCKLVESFLTSSTTAACQPTNENTQNQSTAGTTAAASTHQLYKTGFIRKNKRDKSFSYINIINESSLGSAASSASSILDQTDNNNLNNNTNNTTSTNFDNQLLKIEINSIKFSIRLKKWPNIYKQGYFERTRKYNWPDKRLLKYIEANTCLITYLPPSDLVAEQLDGSLISTNSWELNHLDNKAHIESQRINLEQDQDFYINSSNIWCIDTQLAECILFKCLNKKKLFMFNFFYLIIQNLQVDLSEFIKILEEMKSVNKLGMDMFKMNKFYIFHFLNKRMFMHHFFRFLELNDTNESVNDSYSVKFICNTIELLHKFIKYLINNVIDEYKTLNRPNYFLPNKKILNTDDYNMHLNKYINSVFMIQNCMNERLSMLLSGDLKQALKKLELTTSGLVNKLKTSSNSSSLTNNLNYLNAFLDSCQIRLNTSTVLQHPGSPMSSSMGFVNANHVSFSPLVYHYSSQTYVYEYIYDFFNLLFEQFKSKRDHFQISENLLLNLHDQILLNNTAGVVNSGSVIGNSDNNKFIRSIKNIDRDRLLSKFEEYAECVHKYLPQIRQHNQYLLFHYVWTMQVQYLAPFFNYLCDFYNPIN